MTSGEARKVTCSWCQSSFLLVSASLLDAFEAMGVEMDSFGAVSMMSSHLMCGAPALCFTDGWRNGYKMEKVVFGVNTWSGFLKNGRTKG